jgi:hypothetical protein
MSVPFHLSTIEVPLECEITVVAEKLRDEEVAYLPGQLRYVDGKIMVPVGSWACRRLREIAEAHSHIKCNAYRIKK